MQCRYLDVKIISDVDSIWSCKKKLNEEERQTMVDFLANRYRGDTFDGEIGVICPIPLRTEQEECPFNPEKKHPLRCKRFSEGKCPNPKVKEITESWDWGVTGIPSEDSTKLREICNNCKNFELGKTKV